MRYTFAGEKVPPYFNLGISTTINFGAPRPGNNISSIPHLLRITAILTYGK
jgi:hypothetical protein